MLYFYYYYLKKNTQGHSCHVKEKATHGKNHSQLADQVWRLKLQTQAVNCPGIDSQMSEEMEQRSLLSQWKVYIYCHHAI